MQSFQQVRTKPRLLDIQPYRTTQRRVSVLQNSRIFLLFRQSRFQLFPCTMSAAGKKRKSSEISDTKYYAVKAGKTPGVYTSWEDCQNNTFGFKGAACKFVPIISDPKVAPPNHSSRRQILHQRARSPRLRRGQSQPHDFQVCRRQVLRRSSRSSPRSLRGLGRCIRADQGREGTQIQEICYES